jgi:hypothetical protein
VHRHAEIVHLWCALFSDVVTISCMCSWKKNCIDDDGKKNVRCSSCSLQLGVVSNIYLLALGEKWHHHTSDWGTTIPGCYFSYRNIAGVYEKTLVPCTWCYSSIKSLLSYRCCVMLCSAAKRWPELINSSLNLTFMDPCIVVWLRRNNQHVTL